MKLCEGHCWPKDRALRPVISLTHTLRIDLLLSLRYF